MLMINIIINNIIVMLLLLLLPLWLLLSLQSCYKNIISLQNQFNGNNKLIELILPERLQKWNKYIWILIHLNFFAALVFFTYIYAYKYTYMYVYLIYTYIFSNLKADFTFKMAVNHITDWRPFYLITSTIEIILTFIYAEFYIRCINYISPITIAKLQMKHKNLDE